MLKEFKEFALRGNVIDLAVGIIIGASFTAIVNSVVTDIIMPPIGLLLGDVDFTNLPTYNAERFLFACDLDTKKTRVLGVPLHEDFSTGPVAAEERSRARSVYGIDDANQVVGIIGGREGVKNAGRILYIQNR